MFQNINYDKNKLKLFKKSKYIFLLYLTFFLLVYLLTKYALICIKSYIFVKSLKFDKICNLNFLDLRCILKQLVSNQIFNMRSLKNIQMYKVSSPAVKTFNLQFYRLSVIYPKSFIKIKEILLYTTELKNIKSLVIPSKSNI